MQCAAAVDNLAGYFFKHMPGSETPTPAAAVSTRAGCHVWQSCGWKEGLLAVVPARLLA